MSEVEKRFEDLEAIATEEVVAEGPLLMRST